MDEDLQRFNEARVRLEERNKNQEEDIKEHDRLIEQLFDYKNSILRKQEFLSVNKVSKKDMDEVRRDLTVLKTEKKFLPYIVMILSALTAIGTIVWQILKAFSVGG